MKKTKKHFITAHEFILRKIFTLKQQGQNYQKIMVNLKNKANILSDLISAGYIDETYNFTKGTQALVFRLIYEDKYYYFKDIIKSLAYNPTLFDLYLDNCDITLPSSEIINLDNFDLFVKKIDSNISTNIVEYTPINWFSLFSTENFSGTLYVAHPNQVMENKYISTFQPDFIEVDNWKVNQERYHKNRIVLKYDDYSNNAYEVLNQERRSLLKKHIDEPRHLAIIEESNNGTLIRGIIRLDEDGFMSFDNPEYSKICEKRFGKQKSKK